MPNNQKTKLPQMLEGEALEVFRAYMAKRQIVMEELTEETRRLEKDIQRLTGVNIGAGSGVGIDTEFFEACGHAYLKSLQPGVFM